MLLLLVLLVVVISVVVVCVICVVVIVVVVLSVIVVSVGLVPRFQHSSLTYRKSTRKGSRRGHPGKAERDKYLRWDV